jgi:AraC family transcriptional regulator
MAPQDSHSEYERRMHRVLEHVDRHLDEPLELDTLAAVANFSSFHFHRLFAAWMGETLGEYMRRRRLEMAALRLVSQPSTPVFHVALSVGFGSAEAFARAFKSRFGYTPTSWRLRERAKRTAPSMDGDRLTPATKSKRRQANSNPNQAKETGLWNPQPSRNRSQGTSLKVKLIDRQPTTVAYMRHIGSYGQPISEFWQRDVYPWLAANCLLGCPRFGISHDDPNITALEKCRYDACVEAPPGSVGMGKYLATTIPGGKYAVAQFKGTAPEIVWGWAALLRDWLPTSGMQLESRPFFEYYSGESTYDPRTGIFTSDLCIPVAPLERT